MDVFVTDLSEKLKKIDLSTKKCEDLVSGFEKNLENYIEKAKETLKKKNIINPKPAKRFVRLTETDEDEEITEKDKPEFLTPAVALLKNANENVTIHSNEDQLRPIRSAKMNAKNNLKEPPSNCKMRNDNNVSVIVKTERVSSVAQHNGSRDSLKENARPMSRSKVSIAKDDTDKDRRSASVEIINTKPVEIDITHEEAVVMMPPPALPPKQKRTVKQPKVQAETPIDPTQPLPIRFTRSKIKKEKPSVEKSNSDSMVRKSAENSVLRKSNTDLQQSKVDETASEVENKTIQKKVGEKKKYPMPILIKLERNSDKAENAAQKDNAADENNQAVGTPNQTFDVPVNETVTITQAAPINNETITLATNQNVNETVVLDGKNHDSLMTEDNDEEHEMSMNVPLSKLAKSPILPPLKLKKNEVFNPFMASPVKQRVQAFEKHAVTSHMTPEKRKIGPGSTLSSNKFNVLKAGTPSKIATLAGKNTPMSNAKQKYMAAVTSSASSSSSLSVKKSATKKFSSMSTENQEELKKVQSQAQLEEKRKQREEKQKQVQLQREALEKQKREQMLQIQREREEKHRKIMQEKEDQKRYEAMKKKAQKENQERKYAEERARKEELQIQPPSASKLNDSLQIKMQKQIMAEKQKKIEAKQQKEAYCFDMLNTDDSTDDESVLAKKRPEPPTWSKKQYRKKVIIIQSNVNPDLLDTLFSVQPLHVNLKDIFPQIDARKLARNSSAVWNTPPRYSVYANSPK